MPVIHAVSCVQNFDCLNAKRPHIVLVSGKASCGRSLPGKHCGLGCSGLGCMLPRVLSWSSVFQTSGLTRECSPVVRKNPIVQPQQLAHKKNAQSQMLSFQPLFPVTIYSRPAPQGCGRCPTAGVTLVSRSHRNFVF